MGLLAATMCKCGAIHVPPRARCINCTLPTKSIEILDIGKILTFTILHATPAGFDSPLILGLIELELEPERKQSESMSPKVVCLGKISEDELEIGMNVSIENVDDTYFFSKIIKS